MAGTQPEGNQALPEPVPNWPELAGDGFGFRSAEACHIAASWFDRTPTLDVRRKLMRPNLTRIPGDEAGRWVDTETGELHDHPFLDGTQLDWAPGQTKADGDEYRTSVAAQTIRLRIGPGVLRLNVSGLSNAQAELARIDAALAATEAMNEAIELLADLNDDDGQGEDDETDNEETEGIVSNVVREFSRKSRQRLRQVGGELDWYSVLIDGWRVGMVTLTYPGDWETWAPDPATVVRHRQAFDRRFQRATGRKPAYLWKREFQRRKAPHVHMGGVWPLTINGEPFRHWVSRTWYEIVASADEDHLRAGTGVDWSEGMQSSDPNRMASYFASYGSAKGSKEYQNHAPEGWANPNGSVGRHWGYIGVHKVAAEVRISRDDLIEAQRYLRAYLASQKRTMDVKANRGSRSIRQLADGSYQARYIDPLTGTWVTVPYTFQTRADAGRWLATVRVGRSGRTRTVNRRYRLRSLVGTQSGFTFLTNDGPAVAVGIARTLALKHTEPWPKGERRPLP